MKIERRRIGNDVTLTWKLTTNGERTSLAGRDLKVTCKDAYNAAVPVEWTVSGMDIVATVRGKNQRTTGVHILKLIENDGKNDQHVVDAQCFELVDHSWKLDLSQAGDVIISADVTTSLSVAEIEAFRRIAADIPDAMEAATAANEAAAEQLRKGVQRYNNDWWNMNCLLNPGFYEGCWRGRPADCVEGEMFACIVSISKRADQNEGVDVVTQVALSSRDAQRVFTRKILTRDRSVYEPPTTVYEDWKLIGADDKATLLAAINEVAQAVATKQDIINDLAAIRAGAAAGSTAIQQHQDISGKLDKAKIGLSNSGLKKDASDNIVGDVYSGHAGDIIGTIQGQTFDKQLIDVYMLRWVLTYFAQSQDVYTKTQVDNKETALSDRITALSNALDTLIGEGDVTQVIDSFNEVISFLSGISGTTLDSLLTTIRNSVNTEKERAMAAEALKQDIIQDLSNIRSGAAAGATAYQKPQGGIPASSMAEAVQTLLGKAGTALQAHQDISHLVVQIPGKGLSTNDYTNEDKAKLAALPSASELSTDLGSLDQRIKDIEFSQNDYYVEAYTPETTDVTPVKSYGDKALLKRFDFYLLDTTNNTGTTTHPVGKLQANNLLRFADGGAWAPVVGITAAQAADALLELFIKENGNYVQYCAAGEYDAEAYVTNVLRKHYAGTLTYDGPELYKSDGNGGYEEAHALCPWETTEKKYTIGLGFDRKIYILDNVAGESGYVWKGIFIGKTSWDGIDLTPYALEKTAIAPCPVCTIDDNGTHKTRNFFYLYQGDTNCQGYVGLNGLHMFDQSDRTYPRCSDVSQISNMNLARANNANAESPLPFAEGGFFALDAFIIAQELLYSRRNPFRAAQFGSGISSNDTCNSETTWRTNGGVRYKKDDAASPSYATLGTNTPFYYNANAQRSDWSNTLNQYAPKEQCMESQIVASFITEFGLQATTDATAPNYFTVYGGKYYYMNIDDVEGLEDGYMNVRVYRELKAEGTSWYDAEGNAVTYDIEVVLRMSLMAGANLSGDIFAYWGGGAEVVGTCGENTENNTAGHVMDCYLQPDQSKWMRETEYAKNSGGRFGFEAENAYPHLGQSVSMANGYALQRLPYLPKRSKAGGNLSQGECYYSYEGKYWSSTVGQRVRVGLRFRGSAHYGSCSPRYWHGFTAASHPNRAYGGSAQARFE